MRPLDSDQPVVVGIDGSDSAMQAARWAGAVAARLKVPLIILHARPYPRHNTADAIAELRALEMAEDHESAQIILKTTADAVRVDVPDLPILTQQSSDFADVALVDISRRAKVLVLGCDEVTLGFALLVGSTTFSVATHAACPVIAWRGDVIEPNAQPILLGVDGDRDSRLAISSAFELASCLEVGVIAVHAWSSRRSPGDVALPFMVDWHAVAEDQRRHLKSAMTTWTDLYPDVDVKYVVDFDKPARALLRRSRQSQLTIIGSRGRGALISGILGSTGLNLLHHSPVPVMICRSPIERKARQTS